MSQHDRPSALKGGGPFLLGRISESPCTISQNAKLPSNNLKISYRNSVKDLSLFRASFHLTNSHDTITIFHHESYRNNIMR
jgi:hypothetical protein